MSSKSFLHGPKNCWLIETEGSITDITTENWYEQVSSLDSQRQLFFPSIAYFMNLIFINSLPI